MATSPAYLSTHKSGERLPSDAFPPFLLAGPTAVGKSELALKLAAQLDAEIVSVDSMQVYRGMDIGAAKPSLADRSRVPHHLVDELDLNESFNAARFVLRASQVTAGIQQRGRVPLLCGGTGLYFRAFLHGLDAAPPLELQLRAQLQSVPLAELLQELKTGDPLRFASIDRQNPRRVLRAVEILRQKTTASSASVIESAKPRGYRGRSVFVILTRPLHELRERIDARVAWMFAHGLVEETKSLLSAGLKENSTALQALGYRQVVEHLQGVRSLADTVALVQIRTRQFAKRQLTWFRKEAGAEWLELSKGDSPDAVASELAQRYRRARENSNQ